jgi:ADP-ribose pyrophosphatase YjhB (NUDIX family)
VHESDGNGRMADDRRWLNWARRVAALAQNGLAYAEGVFDRVRYEELQEIAAEMLASGGGGEPDDLLRLLRSEAGYATPKVDVRGVVFRDERILLVRETEDGLWSLPGGWADAGESPREAVEKEIREESGFESRAVKLLAVYDRDRHGVPPLPWSVYKMFIRCEITGGEASGSIETIGVGFFAEEELPGLSESRATAAQIRRMFEHLRSPQLITDFD